MSRYPLSFHRRPFFTPVWLTAVAAAMVFSLAIFLVLAAWRWGTADATTVIVIRHAEKELGAGADPPLTPAGQARAESLVRMFGDARAVGHIDAIYVSPALRNRLTAAPLAAQLGLTAIVAPADDPAGLARRALREHGGGRVLIVGHSDTVPAIVEALDRNAKIPPPDEDEYGTMYIVTVPRIGHANFLRVHY